MSRATHFFPAAFVVITAAHAVAQPAETSVPANPVASPAAVGTPNAPSATPPAATPPAAAQPSAAPAAKSEAGPTAATAVGAVTEPSAATAQPAPSPTQAPTPELAQPAEPLGMGEQPGGVVYGSQPAPPAQVQTYGASWPAAGPACGHGYCGPDCRQRCRRHEYCSESRTCEPVRELDGQEHMGLLVRATTGYGFGALSASDAGVRESNLMVGLGVDIGGAVVENLIVRGRIRGAVSYYRDNPFGQDVLFSFGTLGAGVDYYFMPINIYIGGTLSVAGIARADEDRAHRSKAGLGLDLDIGKEWWVGRHWGIGIALRATYMDVAPANILSASHLRPSDARLRSVHVGMQFSATFN